MALSEAQRAELRAKLPPGGYDGSVASRAQMVLWHDEGHSAPEIAATMGTSKVTVYKGLERYAAAWRPWRAGSQRDGRVRCPAKCVLVFSRLLSSHRRRARACRTGRVMRWPGTSKRMRVSGSRVTSFPCCGVRTGIQPDRQGTFKLSHDPDFAAKVVDVVGLYLDPVGWGNPGRCC
jgi:hypothetical protein